MPTYEFRDKNTGAIHEKFLSFTGKDEYLAQNPHLEQTITSAPAFVGDHVVIKKDTGFKEVLQKINERAFGGMKESGSSQL